MAWSIHSYHFASKGRGVTGGRAGLQHVHAISSIEKKTEDGGESLDGDRYITGGGDLQNFGRTRNNGESIKISYVEVAVIGERSRHDVALARRNICDSRDLTRGRNFVELAVVWFDGVQSVTKRDHAIPSSIGFKIARVGVSDRISLHKGA